MFIKLINSKDIVSIEIAFAELLKEMTKTKSRISSLKEEKSQFLSKLRDKNIEKLTNVHEKLYNELIEYIKLDFNKIDFLFDDGLRLSSYYKYNKTLQMIYETMPKNRENIIKFINYAFPEYLSLENFKEEINKFDFCLEEIYRTDYHYSFSQLWTIYDVLPKTNENITSFLRYCLAEIAQNEMTGKCLDCKEASGHDKGYDNLTINIFETQAREKVIKLLMDLGDNPLKQIEYDQELTSLIFNVLGKYIYTEEYWTPARTELQELSRDTGYGGGGSTVEYITYEEVTLEEAKHDAHSSILWFVDEYTLSLFRSIPSAKRKMILEELEKSAPDLAKKLRAGKPEEPSLYSRG